jgi:N-acylneuraminate cytidylyltransferase
MLMRNGACLAVIPARGGSKRIPQKNIRTLGGKPLLAYAIQAAQGSNLFEKVIVSTDSEAIAEIARQLGAHVPFLRGANLADDITPVSAVTADVLDKIDSLGQRYQHVCQLMPNCPLRTTSDVVQSHRQFVETGAQAQISVVRYGWQNPWWAMRMNEQHLLDPVFKDVMTSRSQDLPSLYCPTGAVWWIQADVLRKERSFHIPAKTGWEMPWQNGLDIDTPDDWDLAEVLFQFGFGKSDGSI